MTYLKVWVEVRDAPGQLGGLAGALGAAEIDIVAIDVHPLGEANIVSDELTLDLRERPASEALDVIGALSWVRLRGSEEVDPHALVDPLTAALRSGRLLVDGSASPAERVAQLLGTVVAADLVTVTPGAELAPEGLVSRASRTGWPLTELAWLQRLPGEPATLAWSLAVPRLGASGTWVGLLSRSERRFSPTEIARAQAAMDLAVAMIDQPAGSGVGSG